MTDHDWPIATLDRIRRLRVLAATIPNATMAEAVIDAPFDRMWPWFADLERSVPVFDGQVRRLRIRARHGDRLDVMTRVGPGALVPWPFDVVLQEGWCLMAGRARLYVVGMAAEPAGEQTRVGVLEGIPLRGGRVARPTIGRHVRGDLRGIGRALGVNATPIASPPAGDDPVRRRRDRG